MVLGSNLNRDKIFVMILSCRNFTVPLSLIHLVITPNWLEYWWDLKTIKLIKMLFYFFKRSPSRSRSRSKSPRRKRSGKKLYITSFGGNDSDDDTGKVVQGPALPPEMGPSMKESSETSSENKQPVSWSVLRLYFHHVPFWSGIGSWKK